MTEFAHQILEETLKIGLNADEKHAELFEKLYQLVVEYNEKVNLTAITERNEFLKKHFLDSLLALNVSRETFCVSQPSVIDVGTGAGFPGFPLAIFCEQSRFTLVDSLNKRVAFLNQVIDQLQLANCDAVHARAEELARDENFRDSFDVCVSRAVAELCVLSEYCLPFVKTGGVFIAYKAKDCEAELSDAESAIKKLGGSIFAVRQAAIPDTDIERRLVFIKKTRPTPQEYPRKAGIPKKSPL